MLDTNGRRMAKKLKPKGRWQHDDYHIEVAHTMRLFDEVNKLNEQAKRTRLQVALLGVLVVVVVMWRWV